MTGGKLGNKQSERIVKMVSKHMVTYSTIYLHICISLKCPLIYVTGCCTGTLDGLVDSHTRLAIYPTLAICCQRVVIHALLDTRFKGMQVVTCPANIKHLKSH